MEEKIAQLEEDTLDPKEGHEITGAERKENVISEASRFLEHGL
jgi:hypothetical protein